ncbi:hypothetical protein U9M48_006946 [Paspalum notatum var. saurae]|uniref:Uncharacterized protein n=1 Tax=Paspalum notatum var. saurae TaxID=547442 RepID=A0AAQ3SGL9_PASNO
MAEAGIAAPGLWAVVAAVSVVVIDALVRWAHGWAREASLGAGRRARLPPGDMGWPVVGTMWSFIWAFKSGNPDSFIGSFVRRCVLRAHEITLLIRGRGHYIITLAGDARHTYRFGRTGVYRAFMFSSPTILVTTPDACKRVAMDDDGFTVGWPKATVALLGAKSFLTLPYEEHRRLRKLTAAPINGFDALTTYLGFIDRTVVSALRRWSEAGEIEFLTELRRMTFEIIVQIFLTAADSATMRALESSYTDFNYGIRAMAINLPGFAFHKAFKARKKLVSVLQGVLNERRAAKRLPGSSMDMMDRLIEAEDEHGRRLGDEEIIDILIMYLNAGHESSGHISMWATLFLQETPEIFAKAKVIDETLRFVNISFISFREATKDVFVNGYLIPKGWKVQLWYRSVHVDPEVYPDPKNFNPSRWKGRLPRTGEFLPFGLGTRLCPGNDLAKLEISVFLHHFLLGYKLTRTNQNCRIRYLPHPRPVDNCLAKITAVSIE